MKNKRIKNLLSGLVLVLVLFVIQGVFCTKVSFYLPQGNLSFRLIRGQNTVLYDSEWYRGQFKYEKFMIGIYEKIADEILDIEGATEKSKAELVKSFGEYIKSKGIGWNNKYSVEEIEGMIFKGVRELSDIKWGKLLEKWDEDAATTIESKTDRLTSFSEFNRTALNYVISGNGSEEVAKVFENDYQELLKSIKNLQSGDSLVIIPETINELIIDLRVFGKLLAQDKGVSVTFILRKDRLRNYPTKADFKKIVDKLGLNKYVEAKEVDTQNPGVHLNELNEKARQAIAGSNLLIIQGGKNAITTQFIDKEHFLIGVPVDQQTEDFTGVDKTEGYVAYVPRSVAASLHYDSDRPTLHNLKHFVQVLLEERKKLNSDSEEFRKKRERINKVGAVLWYTPRVLGESKEAKEALKTISNKFKFGRHESLETAIEKFLKDEDIQNEFIYPKEIFGIDKYYNAKKLAEKLPSKSYYEDFNENGMLGNIIILPLEKDKINFHTAKEFYKEAEVSPQEVVRERYNDQEGLIINGGYFLTKKLVSDFNNFKVGYSIPDSLIGSYLGFLKKKDGTVYPPLFNKGAIIFTKDDVFMDRVSLERGEVKIGNTRLDVKVNTNNFTKNDTVVYTPAFEEEIEEEMFEEFRQAVINAIDGMNHTEEIKSEDDFVINKFDDLVEKIKGTKKYDELYHLIDPYVDSNKEEAKRESLKNLIKKLTTDYNLFQLKVPKRGESILNLVIVDGKVIAKKSGDEETGIPPFGYVVSIPEKFIPEGYNLKELNNNFEFIPKIELTNHEDLELNQIQKAIGGLTAFFPKDGNDVNNVMIEEKTHLISSRRSQETDFALIDDPGPRQVIGILVKEGKKFLGIFTISGRLFQYGLPGANFFELIEVINDKLPSGYNIEGLINLDGGASVSTSYFNSSGFYNVNIPAPGPGSKAGEVRPVNSVFVIEW